MPDVLDERLRVLARELVADAPAPPPRPDVSETLRPARFGARRLVAATVAFVLLVGALVTVVALDRRGGRDGDDDPAVSVTPSIGDWRSLPTTDGAYTLRSSFPFWTGRELVTIRTESSGRGVEGEVYRPSDDSVRPIAPSGLDPRCCAAVTWTGSEVVVAGGSAKGGVEDGAAAYDPETDTWRTLADPLGWIPNGPDLLAGPAIWTGQEMIVWQSRLAFDPRRNTWRRIAPSPLSPRMDESVVAVPGGLLVWGGCSIEAAPNQCDDFLRGELDDGAVYDAARDEWTMLPDGPLAAAFHPTSVWTGKEVVVVVNRPVGTEGVLAAAYNPETRSWRRLPRPQHDAGMYAVSVWTGRRMVTHSPTGVVTALDPVRRTWETLPSGPARDRQSAAWTGREFVITGGYPTGEPWALRLDE